MRVGVVGLGCMGASTPRRLMKAGHSSAFLFTWFGSRKQRTFAEETLAALRFDFGGPVEPTKK